MMIKIRCSLTDLVELSITKVVEISFTQPGVVKIKGRIKTVREYKIISFRRLQFSLKIK